MNTTELIERVAAENGVAKEHARKIVESTFAAIIEAAAAGGEVSLSGFGRFKVGGCEFRCFPTSLYYRP